MGDRTSNDNSELLKPAHLPEPDAHGQAAMLLCESILHGLIARSIISVADAIEIVEVAVEIKAEVAADLGDSEATMRRSLALLGAVRMSLTSDL